VIAEVLSETDIDLTVFNYVERENDTNSESWCTASICHALLRAVAGAIQQEPVRESCELLVKRLKTRVPTCILRSCAVAMKELSEAVNDCEDPVPLFELNGSLGDRLPAALIVNREGTLRYPL